MFLYGASGHCKVIIDCISSSTDAIIEGVFDDNVKDATILNIPILKFKDFDKQKIIEANIL